MFLRVPPTKRIARFGMAGKLSPRYSGPYPIIQGVGDMAYLLLLPLELLMVCNVFHVSQLWKYVPDPSHIVEPDPIQL